ncbi:DNA/RNA non-specific endonuclease [Alkalihalophilus sp. As8PL]|uniref:DNA/RNA non-specific endonuclease n=1 Tax=Alkalihalophilus sp. As8PL TaxID=3237103 RepID=A0AB39BP74_9BACI
MRVNRKKQLKPNVEYVTPAGYKYTTDAKGRIATVEAKLDYGLASRNAYAQRQAGGPDRLPTDDGGHLIASIFKGSGDIDNLVPMNANINRGEYKKLEYVWAQALRRDPPETVEVKIKPLYRGGSKRPERFQIQYSIGNGSLRTVNLKNRKEVK